MKKIILKQNKKTQWDILTMGDNDSDLITVSKQGYENLDEAKVQADKLRDDAYGVPIEIQRYGAPKGLMEIYKSSRANFIQLFSKLKPGTTYKNHELYFHFQRVRKTWEVVATDANSDECDVIFSSRHSDPSKAIIKMMDELTKAGVKW
ncbi:MAG: hypothetical protein ACKVPJ_13630 [Chitinophagales bacterium]